MPQIYHDGKYLGNGRKGHIIEDTNGNEMPARTSLRFKGNVVTDNESEDVTIVEIPESDGAGKKYVTKTAKIFSDSAPITVTKGMNAEVFNEVEERVFNSGDSRPKTGNISSKQNSHAEGAITTADGDASHAEGHNTFARGLASHAEGMSIFPAHEADMDKKCEGSGDTSDYANVYYYNQGAKGKASHSEGGWTSSVGDYSHAEGANTYANGYYSHAEGIDTLAYGVGSHAEGIGKPREDSESYSQMYGATGGYSHSEGSYNLASGMSSHAEGTTNKATGPSSHAEGSNNEVTAQSAHAEGAENTTHGQWSHIEGHDNSIGILGSRSHVEGEGNFVNSGVVHIEGLDNKVTSNAGNTSHLEGIENESTNIICHVEGRGCTTSGRISHAEGFLCQAQGDYSHAQGYQCIARGEAAFASGKDSLAHSATYHSTALGTGALAIDQTAIGPYNDPKSGYGYIFVVGNGTSTSARSNIIEVGVTKVNINGNLFVNGQQITPGGSATKIKHIKRNFTYDIENDYTVTANYPFGTTFLRPPVVQYWMETTSGDLNEKFSWQLLKVTNSEAVIKGINHTGSRVTGAFYVAAVGEA